MTGGGLVDLNLGGLAEPVKVLIERVSDAVGGIARPWQIERVAKAEGRAEIVRAEARIQVSEIEQRAIQRLVKEEGRRQENIETITAKATENVSDNAKPELIDEDWLTNFFASARNISDEKMQRIWAGILSGEANLPGSFSRKTVDLLATLDKRDAESFAKVARFTVIVSGRPLILIYDLSQDIYKSAGIDFEFLTALEDLGLIKFNNITGYSLTSERTSVPIIYGQYHKNLMLKEDKILPLGSVLFTSAGLQLSAFLELQAVSGFAEYLEAKWLGDGISVSPRELR